MTTLIFELLACLLCGITCFGVFYKCIEWFEKI